MIHPSVQSVFSGRQRMGRREPQAVFMGEGQEPGRPLPSYFPPLFRLAMIFFAQARNSSISCSWKPCQICSSILRKSSCTWAALLRPSSVRTIRKERRQSGCFSRVRYPASSRRSRVRDMVATSIQHRSASSRWVTWSFSYNLFRILGCPGDSPNF